MDKKYALVATVVKNDVVVLYEWLPIDEARDLAKKLIENKWDERDAIQK